MGIRAKTNSAPVRDSAQQLLLDAASALMEERDTIDIPLLEIARRAGVNVALVSYYFGGKDGLLLALAKRDAAQALADLDKLMHLDLGPAEKLRRHMAGIITTFFRFPYLNPLLRALMRESSSKSARDIAAFLAGPMTKAIGALLEEGAKRGEIRPVNPVLFFFAATGACEQLFTAQTVLRFVFNIKGVNEELCRQYAAAVTDIFMNGYLAAPRTSGETSTPSAL